MRYYKGTSAAGFVQGTGFTGYNTQCAMEFVGDRLVVLGAVVNDPQGQSAAPDVIARYTSTNARTAAAASVVWSGPITLVTDTTGPPNQNQWYWAKPTLIPGSVYMRVLWQDRYTGYQISSTIYSRPSRSFAWFAFASSARGSNAIRARS